GVLAITSGFFAGLFTAAAGVGGPVLTAYAVLSRWAQREFIATIQPFFTVAGATVVASQLVIEGPGIVSLTTREWLVILVMPPLGVLVGNLVAKQLSPEI